MEKSEVKTKHFTEVKTTIGCLYIRSTLLNEESVLQLNYSALLSDGSIPVCLDKDWIIIVLRDQTDNSSSMITRC